ncbi:MAG: macrolide transporter ATP-binding /permease protein [Methanomassiliicoccales archaeon PtaU1.Bin124]|nr:MAG: macrolide transporter ATP-binding /permease protein [Methanomassiliicoccales archaeon PtaU1.Bin124]
MVRARKTNVHIGLFKLISSNVHKRPLRNVAIAACFAFVIGTMVTAGFLVAGAQMSVQAGVDKMGADMIVIPYAPYSKDSGIFFTGQTNLNNFNGSIVQDIEATPGVLRVTPQVFAAYIESVPWCKYPVQLIGFDPSSDFTISPLMQTSITGLSSDEIVVGQYVRGDIGTAINIAEKNYTIVSRLEMTGFSPDYSVYFTMEEAYNVSTSVNHVSGGYLAQNGDISAVFVKADRSIGIDPVLYWISSLNPGVLVYPMTALGREVTAQFATTTQTLYLTTAVVILVSMPLVALISMMGANERRREIGILRAMGATTPYVFRMIFMEAVLLAIIGGVIGIIASSALMWGLHDWITSSLHTTFLWPSIWTVMAQVAVALMAGIILAGLAAIIPAYRVSQMEPYDSLRRE